ncbi:MAG: hypothetical protein PHN39_00905 [Candidatus Pacebacteria bacterium]|nr:hypothetical protein [Candidatus Paceibacterota bacterium]
MFSVLIWTKILKKEGEGNMVWKDSKGRTWSGCVTPFQVEKHEQLMDQLEAKSREAKSFGDWKKLFYEPRGGVSTERSDVFVDSVFEGLFTTASSFEELKQVEYMSHFARRRSEYRPRIAIAMEPYATTLEEWREILSLTYWPPDTPISQRARKEFDRLKEEARKKKAEEKMKEGIKKGICWADEIIHALLMKFNGSASNAIRGGWQVFPKIQEGLYTEVRVVNRGFTVWMSSPEKVTALDPSRVEVDCCNAQDIAEQAIHGFAAEYGFVEINGISELPTGLAYIFNLPRRVSYKFWAVPGHEKEVAASFGL